MFYYGHLENDRALAQDNIPAVLQQTVYDHVFVGGGLASLFAAYATLAEAKAAGIKLDVLVLAEQIKAPVTAGSHWVQQIEGMMVGRDAVSRFDDIRALLKDARNDLVNTVARENIDCRFLAGYEIKAKTDEDLNRFIAGALAGGVFESDEAAINSTTQKFRLSDYDHSLSVTSMGQANTPELLEGIARSITRMGGHVLTGVHYHNHTHAQDGGHADIETSRGRFRSRRNPFLATGALHATTLPDFHFAGRITYTGALVVGPLSDVDARAISAAPMAICDVNVNDDVFWGGLDPKNMLTVGHGDLDTEDDIPALARKLTEIANRILPDVTQKYPSTLSTGPLFTAENGMPVVGRMKDYDLATGWAGLGIVPAFAAAKAYARWYIHGDDAGLCLFESLQPGGFTGAPPPAP